MPLIPIIFADAIREFADPDFGGFAGHPQSAQDAAIKWGAAFKKYMLLISNPIVPPPAHNAAESAMVAALAGLNLPPPVGILALQAGFVAYVATLAPLSAPFVSIPPAGPPPIVPLPPTPQPAAALIFATIIDAWVRTGMASVPPAPPVPYL